MIKLRKKYKELNLLVKKKQSVKKPRQYMSIFNSKKVITVGKKTAKNIIYTHTILLLVIYSTDKQTVVIINCQRF